VLKKDDLVIIRAYGGKPLIRRIWNFDAKAVYVINDSMQGIVSLGFPREDVFKYDPKVVSSMDQLYKAGKWDWNKLVAF
jgi:hypothetical protein